MTVAGAGGPGRAGGMMALSIEEVEHVARLACLALTGEEKELFSQQLSDVLEHARVISEVDTSSVEPTSHPIPLTNVFREDEVTPSLSVEEATSNAPVEKGGFFSVPRIL